jgi:hypothetical protein
VSKAVRYWHRKQRGLDITRLMARNGSNCTICGEALDRRIREPRDPRAISFDHIVPRSAGGDSKLANLRLAHRECNERRGNDPLDVETIRPVSGLRDALDGVPQLVEFALPVRRAAPVVAGELVDSIGNLRGQPVGQSTAPEADRCVELARRCVARGRAHGFDGLEDVVRVRRVHGSTMESECESVNGDYREIGNLEASAAVAAMTEVELDDLIDRDPIAALCHVVHEAGLTMTLYGVPIGEAELRSSAEHAARERVEAAMERGRDLQRTTEDR